MKRLTQISLTTILLLLLTGCNPTAILKNEQLDPKLPKLTNIKAIPAHTSVAFEWQSLAKKGITGYNVYRTDINKYVNSQTKQLKKVAVISNRFATHYVDTKLKQNSTYTYTFTTVKDGFESSHGKVIDVKTLAPFDPITFFQGFQKTKNTIKLIWRPHSNKKVVSYKIEKSVNGSEWKYSGIVNERMMAEYVDSGIIPGNSYKYRVIAIGYDGSYSNPSVNVTIKAR